MANSSEERHYDNENFIFVAAPEWLYGGVLGRVYWSVLLFIAVAGFIGNVLQFVMMSDSKLSSLSYSVYLKFLSFSDSVMLVAVVIGEAQQVFARRDTSPIVLSFFSLILVIRLLVTMLSPWLVVGLTLDRYVCVCFPLTRDKLCTRMKAFIVCFSIFVSSLAMVTPIYIFTGDQDVDEEVYNRIDNYSLFFRLLFSSTLPCLIILTLTVFIAVKISRSNAFRKTFSRSGSNSTNQGTDSATRPLVLLSFLAFLTLLPVSVLDCIGSLVLRYSTEKVAIMLTLWKIRPFFTAIYLLNFGQNFYILISSSQNYRRIIKKKLPSCKSSEIPRQTTAAPDISDTATAATDISFSTTAATDISRTTTELGGDSQAIKLSTISSKYQYSNM